MVRHVENCLHQAQLQALAWEAWARLDCHGAEILQGIPGEAALTWGCPGNFSWAKTQVMWSCLEATLISLLCCAVRTLIHKSLPGNWVVSSARKLQYFSHEKCPLGRFPPFYESSLSHGHLRAAACTEPLGPAVGMELQVTPWSVLSPCFSQGLSLWHLLLTP